MLYIILGIAMVIYAWMHAAFGKSQKFKNEARNQWVRINALLQTRSQYILAMLELAHENDIQAGDLLAEIYELGGGYCKADDREIVSEYAENVTPLLDQLLELAERNSSLAENKDFQELKENLAELEEEIEIQSSKYNHFIDLYNEHLSNPKYKLQFIILGAPTLKGIHIK
ncbi:MAG: LemA family protein [Bacillota bacterium]